MKKDEINRGQLKRIRIIDLLCKAGANFKVNNCIITLYGDLLLLQQILGPEEFKEVEAFFVGSPK